MNNDPSLKILLRQLVQDTSRLFRQELRLAQREVSDNIEKAQAKLTLVLVGILLGFCAVIILLQAIVLALTTVMSPWAASVLVAAVTGVVALVLVKSGQNALKTQQLSPARAMRQMEQDKELVMEKVS